MSVAEVEGVEETWASTLGRYVRAVPSVTTIEATVRESPVGHLVGGVGALGEWLGRRSLDPSAVLAAYRARGHEITDLGAVRALDLADVLAVRPPLRVAYALVAAVQGGLAGLLGGLGSVAPRPVTTIATAAGVLGAESILTTATCVRAVAHVGAYYGYDPRDEGERVVVLTVLAAGLTPTTGPTPLDDADHRHLTALVVARLSVRLGQYEIARLVPALGVVLAAAMAARLLADVVTHADGHYRARFVEAQASS